MATKRATKRTAVKRKTRRIDVHSHVVPQEMLDALSQRPERFKMRYIAEDQHRRVVREGGGGQPVFDEFFDPAAKVAGMDRKGLDVSVISPAPIVYFYWLDADAGLEAAQIVNDGIANMVRAFPERLMGMGEEHPIAMINKVKGLSAKDREQIFSKTALRLIGKRV